MTQASQPQIEENVQIPRRRLALHRIAMVFLLAAVCASIFLSGMHVRRVAWEQTDDIRFVGDVANGYRWGLDAWETGILSVYRSIDTPAQPREHLRYGMDYPPLRITVMSFWAHWARSHFGDSGWNRSFEFHAPVIWLNSICEFVSAVAVMIIVLQFCTMNRPNSALRNRLLAIFAGALVWFNPTIILNDAWPQWDAWILPAFAVGLWLAMRGWWFASGVLLAIGAMLKGQILMISPVFFLWPICSGQWKEAIRNVCGFVFGFTLIASFWIFTSWQGTLPVWVCSAICLLLLLICRGYRKLMIWSFCALLVSAGPWICVWQGSGDMSWYQIGFAFASQKHMQLAEVGTSNLPSILQMIYNWQIIGPGSVVELGFTTIPLRELLTMAYGFCVLVCGVGAAIYWRRRDARFLVAMYAPWVLMFALMPQMNNRYLYWAGGLFPLLLAVDLGLTLLGAMLCGISCAMMLEVMCRMGSPKDPTIANYVSPLYPGIGFAVLMISMVFLYVSFPRFGKEKGLKAFPSECNTS